MKNYLSLLPVLAALIASPLFAEKPRKLDAKLMSRAELDKCGSCANKPKPQAPAADIAKDVADKCGSCANKPKPRAEDVDKSCNSCNSCKPKPCCKEIEAAALFAPVDPKCGSCANKPKPRAEDAADKSCNSCNSCKPKPCCKEIEVHVPAHPVAPASFLAPLLVDRCGSCVKPQPQAPAADMAEDVDNKCGSCGKPRPRSEDAADKGCNSCNSCKPKPCCKEIEVYAPAAPVDPKCGSCANKPKPRAEDVADKCGSCANKPKPRVEEDAIDKCGSCANKPKPRDVDEIKALRSPFVMQLRVITESESAEVNAHPEAAYLYLRNWSELADFAAEMSASNVDMQAIHDAIEAGSAIEERAFVINALASIVSSDPQVVAQLQALQGAIASGDHDLGRNGVEGVRFVVMYAP